MKLGLTTFLLAAGSAAAFAPAASTANGAGVTTTATLTSQTTTTALSLSSATEAAPFAQGPRIRVIRIAALAARRGPAADAALLYEDMSPPLPPRTDRADRVAPREPGAGRPIKRDRRAIDRLRDG